MKKTKPKKTPAKPVQKPEAPPVMVLELPPIKAPGNTPKAKHSIAKRLEALAAYLSDMSGCTVEHLHTDERFKEISLPTLRRWADEDEWMKHRKEAYDALAKRLAGETKKVLTDQLYHEVQELQKWDKKASELLSLPGTLPKSWEGVMKIKLEIQARLGAISEKVSAGVIDELGKPVAQGQQKQIASGPKTDFTPEQLKALAKIYTQQQRDKLRDKLRVSNPEMFEDGVPEDEQDDEDYGEETAVPGADPGTGAGDIIPELQAPVAKHPKPNHGDGG